MTRNARQMFVDIDAMNMEAFLGHLAEDVTFRFGNAEPIHGRDAVQEAISGFWSSIADLTHHVYDVWEVDSDASVFRMDVEYIRHDGQHVTVPNVDVLHWRDGAIVDFQAYIDLAPVYA